MDKAITQTVIAEPVSLSFGVQQWPHADDKPVTKKLTYRNLGTEDVTLKLTSTATGPKGKAAPAGFFTLGASTLTVPANGTASVDVTADTRLGGAVDGTYSAYVVATGAGQSVRTAAAVEREVESYNVTLKVLDRSGKATANYMAYLSGLTAWARTGRTRRTRPTAPSACACPRAVTSWTPACSWAPTRRRGGAPTGSPSPSWTSPGTPP